MAKVLREGAIVGLANHTVLIAGDGTDIPIRPVLVSPEAEIGIASLPLWIAVKLEASAIPFVTVEIAASLK